MMQEIDWTLDLAGPINLSHHSVLFEWPITLDEKGIPKPKQGKIIWNNNFVRLPFHSENKIQFTNEFGEAKTVERWCVIKEALSGKITTSQELEDAIKVYNPQYKEKWNFRSLHKMIEDLNEDETEAFFTNLLPHIIKLALDLPNYIKSSIPLVKQQTNFSVSLSQQQIASLLANAFLCTFPRRNNSHVQEYYTYPDINFSNLFNSMSQSVIQKIISICHYFRCITKNPRNGVVTFMRRSISSENLPKWESLDIEIGCTKLTVLNQGTIEDSHSMLQADFANKFLGGGVLGYGCVQEEIRFVICPELIISKLFMECLNNNEAVWVIGCERFSNYSGYASNFRWSGSYDDKTPFDTSCRRKTCIVAIDALNFRSSDDQFDEKHILRELNKAYVGFFHDLNTPSPPVASGNWGCGAFGGDPLLKSLLQVMVCAAINRSLVYYTFGNTNLKENIEKMYKFLLRNQITIAMLWKYLNEFCKHKLKSGNLYSFIYQCFYDEIDKKSTYTQVNEPSFYQPNKQLQTDVFPKENKVKDDPSTSCQDSSNQQKLIEKSIPKLLLTKALDSDYYEAKGPVKKLCKDTS